MQMFRDVSTLVLILGLLMSYHVPGYRYHHNLFITDIEVVPSARKGLTIDIPETDMMCWDMQFSSRSSRLQRILRLLGFDRQSCSQRQYQRHVLFRCVIVEPFGMSGFGIGKTQEKGKELLQEL
ncbi:hypothetical protein BJ508DRAFT_45650 [Ascobolus immersus RN42]|uniref:Uncharacterized protein n=1 Tax=Ascobolus immersus RN42 TaxID=1160509 RepID=A0A3N4HIJ6_ASCIM|nr:hypothetical protein BJ508DRAFT_45650 [Ascobolus immersus RN42]